jgi:hypothetical protein
VALPSHCARPAPRGARALIAALAAVLLAAAWSLTCAPQLTASAPGQPALVTGMASAQDGHSALDDVALLALHRELVEHYGGNSTVTSLASSPRHPRRAVPPERKLPPSTAVQATVELDLRASTPRTRRSYEGPPQTDLMPPVESRAPPSERAPLT